VIVITIILVVTTIQPEKTQGANKASIPRNNAIQADIAINNDSFDDAHDFLIDKREMQTLNFQIKNKGANGLSFEIYGSIDTSTIAPAFDLKDWELQTNGSGNIATLTNQIFESKSYLIWVLIRLKRQTASQDTTSDIIITSGTR